MNIGASGIALIEKFEGLMLESYIDTHDNQGSPIYAIGYGHTYRAGPPMVTPGMTITKDQADQILKQDILPYERAVNINVTVPINQNQFDALVSFTYNAGPGNLKTLIANSKLNSGVYGHMAVEMLTFDKSQGKTLAGLTRRRIAEGRLFNTPVEGDNG